MGIIDWNKPRKIRPTDEHNKKYMSDAGVDGTYVPNMSDEDKYKWKGKFISGNDKRVELRKTFQLKKRATVNKIYYAQVLITVKLGEEEPNIILSTNGKIAMTFSMWEELERVVKEAKETLK